MENLDKKLDLIKKEENPCGIIMVGSLAKSHIELERLNHTDSDIDLFVIREHGTFKREVIYIDNVEFDISYISIAEIEYAMEKELSSLIAVLSSYREIYLEDKARELLERVKNIYRIGPSKCSSDYISYNRFKITKNIGCIQKRSEDICFEMMAYVELKNLLRFYFKINRLWVPADKKLISALSSKDIKNRVQDFIEESQNSKKILILEELAEMILEPVGGKKHSWDKSEYPFDFD